MGYYKTYYSYIIMSEMASEITGISIICSGADPRKHQSSTLLAFVKGIHWLLVASAHKGPIIRKMFPFDDVIICSSSN